MRFSVYLLHCTWRCNILYSKHDIDMRMNEWNQHALFLSWNGRNRYLHSSLLKIWDFFHSREKFSVFPFVPLRSIRDRRNFSHSWKKCQIFNKDSCKNLLEWVQETTPFSVTGVDLQDHYMSRTMLTLNLKSTFAYSHVLRLELYILKLYQIWVKRHLF